MVLAFDYTDEDFYGDGQGAWIHGWNGERAVRGKFKFLTCAIVSSDIPEKIPLVSIPVPTGYNMSHEISQSYVVRPLVRSIKLTLYDRGFYSKELMLTLSKARCPYLIFVPMKKKMRSELALMAEDEKKTVPYPIKLYKDMTTLKGSTTLAFLKQVFDKKAFRGRTCSLSYNVRLALFLISFLAAGVWTLEREDAPVSWLGEMPAHLVRFMLTLCALIWFEPELLEWALAIWA